MIFTNGQIVGRHEVFRGTVETCGGQVRSVDTGVSSMPGAMDLEGDFLIAGLIDLHTDALQKHHTPRVGVRWPIPAALAAHDAQMATSGVTTVFDALSIGVGGEQENTLRERLRLVIEELGEQDTRGLRARHFLHLRLELPCADTATTFLEFADLPVLKMVSLTDHTPGQGQYADVERWRAQAAANFASAADFEKYVAGKLEAGQLYSGPNRTQIAASVRERALPLASHDDRTLEDIARGLEAGVTISEFPVTTEAAAEAKKRGLAVLMGGPNLVIGGSHSGNAAASDVAREGWLDGLTSDYVPSSMLQGAFVLAEHHGFGLPEALAMVTSAPAKMVGLEDRGEIAPELRADLIQVRCIAGLPRVLAVWREGQRVA